MEPFTYQYQGKTIDSVAEYFCVEGNHRYRVKINDINYLLAICGWRGPNNTILWVQNVKPGDIVQPHDLIQAIGEGIEKSTLLVTGNQAGLL